MKTIRSLLLMLFIGLMFTVVVGYKTKQVCEQSQYQTIFCIPSPYEIQEMLNEYDPNDPLVVDGIIGDKTMKKWNDYYCNESARRALEEVTILSK